MGQGSGGLRPQRAAGRGLGKRTVRDVPLQGRRVLLRVDFNVPLEGGAVADDTRLRAALPTIALLRERGARVVLCSHLGRPNGAPVPGLSLRPVASVLAELLGAPLAFCPEAVGPEAAAAAAQLGPGDVLLLENTRFYPGEERNDPDFARALAGDADLFVNDAFGAAHRAHASTVGVAAVLPAVAGLLLEREVAALSRLLDPEHPFVAVVGGAKVSDKLPVLRRLLQVVDRLLIGGGMANTFLAARGQGVGGSRVEAAVLPEARELLRQAEAQGVEVLLPEDLVAAQALAADAPWRVVAAGAVPADALALDIGPATARAFAAAVGRARTLFWNGPMGVSEWPAFASGTAAVARAVAACPGYTVVGGGDSIAALRRLALADGVDHISTGGGASLEFLEGRQLPGIACLQDG